MKKYILILFALWLWAGSQVQAQKPPCYDANASWDWTNADASNWNAVIDLGGSPISMGSPFNSSNVNHDVARISDAQDYAKTDGWALLFKNFGCPDPVTPSNNIPVSNPHFILYNKFTGMVRIFIFSSDNTPHTVAVVKLTWDSPLESNGLLTNCNPHAKVVSQYGGNATNKDTIVNYLNDMVYLHWSVADFPLTFDPTTDTQNLGERLSFSIGTGVSSTVNLSGTFKFATVSSATAQAAQTSGSSSLLDYVMNTKKYLGTIPSVKDATGYFDAVNKSVNSVDSLFCNTYTRDLHNLNYDLQHSDLKNYLLGAVGVASGLTGGLGILSTVMDFFSGKTTAQNTASTNTYFQPTVSQGNLTLSGTINTNFQAQPVLLQLPGAKHKFNGGTPNYQVLGYYDCPLGVVSVQGAPTIEVKSWTEPAGGLHYRKEITFAPQYYGCPPPPPPANVGQVDLGNGLWKRYYYCNVDNNTTRTVKSYHVNGNITLAFNKAAGVEIESAKAALSFEVQPNPANTSIPAVDVFQTHPLINNPTQPAACGMTINEVFPECGNIGSGFCYYYCSSQGINVDFPYPDGNEVTYFDSYNPYYSWTANAIQDSTLRMSNYDSKGFHKYQTPFVDIDKFNGTAMTIEDGVYPTGVPFDGGVKVFLKVLITLKPTETNPALATQTPIVYVASYEIPAGNFTQLPGSAVAPFHPTCDQQTAAGPDITFGPIRSVLDGDATFNGAYITTNGFVLISPGVNNTIGLNACNKIVLNSNFHTNLKPGGTFHAYIGTPPYYATATSAYAENDFNAGCNPALVNNRLGQFDISKAAVVGSESLTMQIIPNPNNGSFSVSFNSSVEKGVLRVINYMGQTMKEMPVENTSAVQMNLQDMAAGLYSISYISDHTTVTQKCVLQ